MLHIWVSNSTQQVEFDHEDGPLEYGRAQGDGPRVVLEDRYVSRDQLRVVRHGGRPPDETGSC